MSRAKAREALKKVDELEAKRRQQDQLYQELRRSLEIEAYESRRGVAQGQLKQCSVCSRPFDYGDITLELVDDDGSIVAVRHYPNCSERWNQSRDVMERRR